MWLVAVHSLFEQCLLCLREWDLFFSREKRSFRYKNIIFLRYFFSVWSFSMFECEFVVVKPITCLCVCRQKHVRKTRFACLYWCEEVRIQELGWVSVYLWEDHACFATPAAFRYPLCCVSVLVDICFTFFCFFSSI